MNEPSTGLQKPETTSLIEFEEPSDFYPQQPLPSETAPKNEQEVISSLSSKVVSQASMTPIVLERAPASRSKCRKCGENIMRGQLRISVVLQRQKRKPGSYDARIYFHPYCFDVPEHIKSEADLQMVEKLGSDEMTIAKKMISHSLTKDDYEEIAPREPESAAKRRSKMAEITKKAKTEVEESRVETGLIKAQTQSSTELQIKQTETSQTMGVHSEM